MSFLNLKRLLLPRKMWKIFINKMQIKLNKLNRSKAIKKSKLQSHTASKRLGWPSLSIRPKKFKPKHKKTRTSIHVRKRTPPVYVDRLFIEPVSVSGTKEAQKAENEIVMTSEEKPNNAAGADEMWESMVLTSPQTRGINERAEEFIARFRTQMRHQEMLDRNL
ncbi:hypothetical protein OROGR_019476 [Orobanche gracilis]